MFEGDPNRGYSGAAFDRQVVRSDQSPLEKVKEQYWTAKQVVLQKLGKKEDDHLVASDAELDAKLELFGSIKMSSGSLKGIAGRYQKVMHEISKEEYALGQFLKRHGDQDSSRAGEMLHNVSKAFVISAQKRMEARSPLIRLAQDSSTYQRCAVTDTERKIAQMEEARTEYRGTLLWMKNVSEELDPDTYRQLEKFRRVQHQVRQKKEKFDSQKLDTLQKIDLLAISRLNMLSQSLTPYGSVMYEFYEKSRILFGSIPVPAINQNETELRIPDLGKGESFLGNADQDDALLDLYGDVQPQPASSSSEILDALWKESGLESGDFDPLSQKTDTLNLEAGDGFDKKDSPDGPPEESLFNYSELDESEKGALDFFVGDLLTPTKSAVTEKPATKDSSTKSNRAFFPSQLLRKGWIASNPFPPAPSKSAANSAKDDKVKDKGSSSVHPHQNWYNLFSDLDPLATGNQDTVKRTDGKQTEDDNC